MKRVCLLLVIALIIPTSVFAWQGKVIRISDGDTVTVLNQDDSNTIRIRLYGIDCPELRQDFGDQAKAFVVAALADAEGVEIDPVEKDRYGRTVARVYVDGEDLSAMLVSDGLAWVYRKYCKIPECEEWLEAEETARVNGMGLWSSTEAIPPWEWRRR